MQASPELNTGAPGGRHSVSSQLPLSDLDGATWERGMMGTYPPKQVFRVRVCSQRIIARSPRDRGDVYIHILVCFYYRNMENHGLPPGGSEGTDL